MKKRVCVLGGGGAIGSRLTQQLAENNYSVTAVVRKLSSAVRVGRYPIEIKVADLSQIELADLATIFADHDVVIDCTYSLEPDARKNIAASTEIAQKIVDACISNRIHSLIHFGTIAVYPQNLTAIYESISCDYYGDAYADGKLAAQRVLLDSATDDFCPLILQLPIVIGPHMGWTISPVKQLTGRSLIMPDDIKGACNVVYVDDVVKTTIGALQRQFTKAELVILNGPGSLSWINFYRSHAELSQEFSLQVVPRSEYIERQQKQTRASRPWVQFKHALAADGDLRQLVLRQWGIRTLYRVVKNLRGQPALEQIKAGLEKGKPAPTGTSEMLLPQHLLKLFDSAPEIDSSKAQKLFQDELSTDFAAAMKFVADWLKWSGSTP